MAIRTSQTVSELVADDYREGERLARFSGSGPANETVTDLPSSSIASPLAMIFSSIFETGTVTAASSAMAALGPQSAAAANAIASDIPSFAVFIGLLLCDGNIAKCPRDAPQCPEEMLRFFRMQIRTKRQHFLVVLNQVRERITTTRRHRLSSELHAGLEFSTCAVLGICPN